MATDMNELFGDLFDDGPATATAVAEPDQNELTNGTNGESDDRQAVERPEPKSVPSNYLFFDLETVPDYSRESLFDLPPVPSPAVYATENEGPTPSELIKETVEECKAVVTKANSGPKRLPRIILDGAISVEKKRPKPRKGVIDLFEDLIAVIDGEQEIIKAAVDARRKKMSLSPEMCRIVSLGTARGSDVSEVEFVTPDDKKWHLTEAKMLKKFWMLASNAKVIGGFNSNGFDLPVILMRSLILGVAPSRKIDLTPWKGETCDLMALRWPKGGAIGLKAWAKMLAIPFEGGDIDGSQIEELWRSGKMNELTNYNHADVRLTREIYRRGRGMFWN